MAKQYSNLFFLKIKNASFCYTRIHYFSQTRVTATRSYFMHSPDTRALMNTVTPH